VFFRDTVQILTVVMQLLFWFNPIVYPKERFFSLTHSADGLAVFQRIGRILLSLNPFERFISVTQWLFGHGVVKIAPTPMDWGIIIFFPIVCLLAGLFFFRRTLPEIRDCL
jgi:lipopolysaccharide transport system permease protein